MTSPSYKGMGDAIEADDTRALLRGWRAGDDTARDRLFQIFYPELRRAAAALLRRERGVSLSSGDLIHESVARLVQLNRIAWEDRAHFLALAARMMRRAILDHVRAKKRFKRDHEKVMLQTNFAGEPDAEVEALNAALDRLATIDPERAAIVEMRFFGGMEIVDIAQVTGLSESTIKRRWSAARLWLAVELRETGA